jgi:hypothetical protein
MFEEDDQGDLLLVPDHEVEVDDDDEVDDGARQPEVVIGAAAAAIVAQSISDVLELVEAAPEKDKMKTLREMLYEQEPWTSATAVPSPGIRRLQERRVNRILDTVANWILAVVEERIGDEMTLVVLLELAETVREQIVWPELEAHKAAVGLAVQGRELEP